MRQLDPKAVWLFFLSFVLRWVFFVAIIGSLWGISVLQNSLVATGYDEGMPVPINFIGWLISFTLLFFVICFIWAKLSYKFYRYELTDLGFRKESGVIYKKYVTIPYNRIQNVDIYRGILARLLGLSDLNIQTAGSSAVMAQYGAYGMGAEGRLPALSREVAEQLRDELIRRASESRGSQGL